MTVYEITSTHGTLTQVTYRSLWGYIVCSGSVNRRLRAWKRLEIIPDHQRRTVSAVYWRDAVGAPNQAQEREST
ncbi:hypothetical protein GCM10010412_075940 [Nonomuraea recticatena]|uniref:Uncharacterized protein n=1 Tax=Nonomuraea recticatena TaxID=46178 RepID=A0ABN3SWT5_9ACTN